MDKDEFEALAIAVLGHGYGWQSGIARHLGIASRSVRKWVHADEVPDWAAGVLRREASGAGSWPRDGWIVGDAIGDGRRRYVVHTKPPRFIARIVKCSADGPPLGTERPVDIVSGYVFAADPETLLCEIAWLDEPRAGETVAVLEDAAKAIEAERE